MCVYMYVYKYVCMCICMYVCVYLYVCIYMCVCVYVCIFSILVYSYTVIPKVYKYPCVLLNAGLADLPQSIIPSLLRLSAMHHLYSKESLRNEVAP